MPKRCAFECCKQKLKLTDMPCVCENIFCIKHRLPEYHNCTHNFKEKKIVLEKVVHEKIIKI